MCFVDAPRRHGGEDVVFDDLVSQRKHTKWVDLWCSVFRSDAVSDDAASRLTVVEAVAPSRVTSLVSLFDYAYDANGNRESQAETRGLAGETTTYGYDEADRLIGMEYPAGTHLYHVDPVGNRTGERRVPEVLHAEDEVLGHACAAGPGRRSTGSAAAASSPRAPHPSSAPAA